MLRKADAYRETQKLCLCTNRVFLNVRAANAAAPLVGRDMMADIE